MSPIDTYELLYFVVMGTFGAVLYILVNAKNWEDFSKFDYVKRLMLGPCIGFLYHNLYSEYSFPNTIMSIVAGYMGTDFVLSIVDFLKGKLVEKK